MYIWEQKNWPLFTWDQGKIAKLLAETRLEQGRLIGRMEALGFQHRQEAQLKTLTQEIKKSAKIEGEELDEAEVRSSIARHLGMKISNPVHSTRNVDGFVELMIDATTKSLKPLSEERLFDWHAALFPTARSGMRKILVAEFRDDSHGPMQVISGAIGREQIHFQAPPAETINREINTLLEWIKKESCDTVLQSAIVHLWFLTLHPFDDGNGRLARAISEMLLSRSENNSQRFYSLSSQIEKERKDYYLILERTQSNSLDITNWLEWFLLCLGRAIDNAQNILGDVLKKSEFWKNASSSTFNERQNKILNMLLDGFYGKLTSSKYAKLTKCSQDTAYRDIIALVEQGVLKKDASGGRSTSYSLVI